MFLKTDCIAKAINIKNKQNLKKKYTNKIMIIGNNYMIIIRIFKNHVHTMPILIRTKNFSSHSLIERLKNLIELIGNRTHDFSIFL